VPAHKELNDFFGGYKRTAQSVAWHGKTIFAIYQKQYMTIAQKYSQ